MTDTDLSRSDLVEVLISFVLYPTCVLQPDFHAQNALTKMSESRHDDDTQELMMDPVVLRDASYGISYERRALEEWVACTGYVRHLFLTFAVRSMLCRCITMRQPPLPPPFCAGSIPTHSNHSAARSSSSPIIAFAPPSNLSFSNTIRQTTQKTS